MMKTIRVATALTVGLFFATSVYAGQTTNGVTIQHSSHSGNDLG